MSPLDIPHERLRNQHLIAPLHRPADVVESLCAVQAQDYRGALWGIGLRTDRATEHDVEDAIAKRTIVRTWPMRGTLHFVARDDIRWMLRLLAPRVLARCKTRNRQLDLDDAAFAKSRAVLEKHLEGDRALTRPDAYAVLERAGIATAAQRGLHILLVLAMQGVVCFGERRERQPTFVLLDEWIPRSRVLDPDEALGELARRYFTSHGPAMLADLAWWSGLSVGDARRAIEIAGTMLLKRTVAGTEYWSGPPSKARRRSTTAQLLPAWDELTVAYRDRDAFLDPAHAKRTRNGIFSAVVVIDGRIAGLWRRGKRGIETELFARHGAAAREAVDRAVTRYTEFVQPE